jgi:hypothetical protein
MSAPLQANLEVKASNSCNEWTCCFGSKEKQQESFDSTVTTEKVTTVVHEHKHTPQSSVCLRRLSSVYLDSPEHSLTFYSNIVWVHWTEQMPKENEWVLVANHINAHFVKFHGEGKWTSGLQLVEIDEFPYWAKKPLIHSGKDKEEAKFSPSPI